MRTFRTRLSLVVLLGTLLAAAAPAQVAEGGPRQPPALSAEHRRWLETVAALISAEERSFFLSITEEYRRDAFIDEFWRVRDPDPSTRFNELRFRWEEHVSSLPPGVPFDDARALLYLMHGEPGRWVLQDGREVGRCFSRSSQIEVWFYGGSEVTEKHFVVVLLKPGSRTPYQFWLPGMNLHAVGHGRLPTTDIRSLCADELLPLALGFIRQDLAYADLLKELTEPVSPSPEWLATFASMSTDLPAGAETFPASLEIDFPGRNQNRTAVQGVIVVPGDTAARRTFDGEDFHHFVVVGEILRGGDLFESFRYRYELPATEVGVPVPLVFSRYLRPGPIDVRLRVEDVFAHSYARIESAIEVPTAEGMASVRPRPDSPMFRLLAEAREAAERGERALRLVPPEEGTVKVGMVRFETQAIGDFDQVTFFLNDQPILTKNRRPYSVELNLGSLPATHRLRVVGFEAGREVASDEIRLNQGGQRFRVNITEPRPDRAYTSSVGAMVQVETPEGKEVERLEIFLDERRLTTLYQEPYVQAVLLPDAAVHFLRAVAYLEDGSSTEDVVFVNAPDFMEEIEVQYVELHALVTDRSDRPVLDLQRSEVEVFEDGESQTIRRFELVRELPIHAGLLLDISASMADSLDQVRAAALQFCVSTITPKDRISLLTFSTQARAEVRFTNEVAEVERALAGITAQGSTSLYDSIVYAMTYFDGVRGQKALLLLSDGKDENSSFDFAAALEISRRSGVTVYAVGLADASRDKSSRRVLRQLADETGGRAWFVEDASELGAIYQEIEEELRSRYLIAYQSSSRKDPSEFRSIRVELARDGLDVRTMSGYYP